MTRTIKVLKFIAAFGWGGTERQFVRLLVENTSRIYEAVLAHGSGATVRSSLNPI